MEDTILRCTAEITAGYLSGNPHGKDDVEQFISRVARHLVTVHAEIVGERPAPAVPVENSFTDDYIICLEDGERVKLLKRYLHKHHGMTPEEYRAKWELPDDYPFVAKNYSKTRSNIAKAQGLGKT